jgi:hypothetical protein
MLNQATRIGLDAVDARIQGAAIDYVVTTVREVDDVITRPLGNATSATGEVPAGAKQATELRRPAPTRLNDAQRDQIMLHGTAPLRAPGVRDMDVYSELTHGDFGRERGASRVTEASFTPYLDYDLRHEPRVEHWTRGGRSTRADARNA